MLALVSSSILGIMISIAGIEMKTTTIGVGRGKISDMTDITDMTEILGTIVEFGTTTNDDTGNGAIVRWKTVTS